MDITAQDVEELPLTPYLGPLRDAALARLREALAAWWGTGEGWTLDVTRALSEGTRVPTQVDLRSPTGGLMRVLLHTKGEAGAWRAGPVTITVARELYGRSPGSDPGTRDVLRRLDAWFRGTPDEARAAFGEELERTHHAWGLLFSMDERFFRHVERAHNGLTGLLRASFRCNQDCHFCWQGRDWPGPPEELVFRWLEEFAGHGTKQLNVCGGEPTLWSRLPELVERAHHVHGMHVHINTNAIKLRNADYAARLKAAGVGSLLVSLHSHDPELSDRMTRAPGTHRRTVEGIHRALDAGITVILNCGVEADNIRTLPEHARFVREQFVEAHPDNPVRMVNYSQLGKYYDHHRFLQQIVPVDEARPLVTEAARVLDEVGVLLEITGTCGFPACVASEIPELVPWRELQSYDDYHRAARVHDPEPCRGCAAKLHCAGIRREYVQRHGERGLRPFSEVPRSDWYERLARTALAAGWSLDLVDDGS
ncbi:MAG TPA: radical SAM protein [Myxococcota bacterium]|nr:radical SAM protein [Myxococcota bacterium]